MIYILKILVVSEIYPNLTMDFVFYTFKNYETYKNLIKFE